MRRPLLFPGKIFPPWQKKKQVRSCPCDHINSFPVYAGKEGMNAGRRMLIHFIHMNRLSIMPAPFPEIAAIIIIFSYYVNRFYARQKKKRNPDVPDFISGFSAFLRRYCRQSGS